MINDGWFIVKDDFIDLINNYQESFLIEDMYQATHENLIIDSGWYGSYSEGMFVTYLISDYDWENPVIRIVSHDIKSVRWAINVCKDYCLNGFCH